MSDGIRIGDETFISSKRASDITGYSQDYIGQLARKGAIKGQRVGGLWYIVEDSITAHKEKAESYVQRPPSSGQRSSDPDAIITFDGKEYVSAVKGAALTGYHQDYVSQLARDGTVLSRQIGSRWYLERESLAMHKKSKDALLASVQREAVGLRPRSPETVAAPSIGNTHSDAGPHMKYIKEDGHLFPSITGSLESEPTPRKDVMPSSSLKLKIISIPIANGGSSGPQYYSGHHESKKESRKVRRLTAINAIASVFATIVIVVLVGYISIESSAVYARISSASSLALVSTAVDSITRFGDLIEKFIVPEMLYIRSKSL